MRHRLNPFFDSIDSREQLAVLFWDGLLNASEIELGRLKSDCLLRIFQWDEVPNLYALEAEPFLIGQAIFHPRVNRQVELVVCEEEFLVKAF